MSSFHSVGRKGASEREDALGWVRSDHAGTVATAPVGPA